MPGASIVLLGVTVLLSIVPLVPMVQDWRAQMDRRANPSPVVEFDRARAQAEAEADKELTARFEALTAESPLDDYLPSLTPGNIKSQRCWRQTI